MNRRQLIVAFLSTTTTAIMTTNPAHAAPEARTFVATVNGLTTEVNLRIIGNNQFDGTLKEGRGQVGLKGQTQGTRLSGHLLDPASGRPLLPFSAELDGDDTLLLTLQMPQASSPTTVVLRRPGAQPGAGRPARTPAGAALDPQLAGRWHLRSSINSDGGAGFASFTTVRTLVLSPDGQMQQWVRSVGGGGSWSHRSGDELEFSARWTTQGGALWLLPEGQAAYVRAGSYQLEGERMVFGEGQARQIWRR